MSKCSVVLMYEKLSQPLPIGITHDPYVLCIAKQQILREAHEEWQASVTLGDPVIVSHFEIAFLRLKSTLDMIIAPEIESLILGNHVTDDHDIESTDDEKAP